MTAVFDTDHLQSFTPPGPYPAGHGAAPPHLPTARSPSIAWIAAFSVLVSLAVCWLSILVYDRYLATRPRPMATISLQEVIDARRNEFSSIVAKPGATDDDRARALAAVEGIAPQLAAAVNEIAKSCNCVLLVKEAVVGTADFDLTPQLLDLMRVAASPPPAATVQPITQKTQDK